MEKYNGILTGFVSNVLGNALMFITTLIIVRLIDPSIYGEFRFVFAFVSMFVIVLLLGRDAGIIYYAQLEPDNKNIMVIEEVFYGGMLLLAGTALLYLFGERIVHVVFHNKITVEHYRFAILMLPLWGLFNLLLPVIKVFGLVNYSFVIQNLIQRIMRFVFLVSFVLLSKTFESLVFAMLVSQIVLIMLIVKKIPIQINLYKQIFKNFFLRFGYSAKLGLNSVVFVALLQIDTLMIGVYLDNESVAIYDIVVMLAMVVTLPFIALVKSSEAFMQAIVRQESSRLKYYFDAKLSIILSLGVVLFYLTATKEVLSLFGSIYSNTGVEVLLVLSFGYLIMLFLGAPIELLNMNGRGTFSTIILLLSLALNTGLNYYFIPKYGINGASFSTVVSIIFSRLVAVYFVYKTYGKSYVVIPAKAVFIFVLLGVFGIFVNLESLLGQIIFSGALILLFYFSILMLDSDYNNIYLKLKGFIL